jgi:hypothetical protein
VRNLIRRLIPVLCLAVLVVPALAGEPINENRLRFTYGRAAVDVADFLDSGQRWDVVGANYEKLVGEKNVIGFQVDAYRPRFAPDVWTVSPSLNLHTGPMVWSGGLDYLEEPGDWAVNVGAGIDGCSDHFCGQFVVRYHESLSSQGGDLELTDEYHLTAQAGIGFGW